MAFDLADFERIVRGAYAFTDASDGPHGSIHPFEGRNIHPDFPIDVRDLFDNGHFSQCAFEAFKFLDEEVNRISALRKYGFDLMMQAFGSNNPPLPLNPMSNPSEISEQDGYKFLFAGSMRGIRNLRGHKTGVVDTPDACLDYLVFASMLLRKLESAGLRS